MYHVYILKSQKHNRYYIGSTKDVAKRLEKHNSGGSTYTRAYRPWEVIYTEQHPDRKVAEKRERVIKSYKGGEAFKRLLKNAGVV
ncbi:MAG: GIY-YIG nuclease family protein [Candidatus Gracilibacteria bacterium]